MEKKKVNRKRKHRVEVYFDDNEMKIIKKKIASANIKSQSEYFRKMAVFGKTISIDFPDLKRTFTELSRIGNNVNQMVKIGYETGSLYKGDIMQIKSDFEQIKKEYTEIFTMIVNLYDRIEKSDFKEILDIMDKKKQ